MLAHGAGYSPAYAQALVAAAVATGRHARDLDDEAWLAAIGAPDGTRAQVARAHLEQLAARG